MIIPLVLLLVFLVLMLTLVVLLFNYWSVFLLLLVNSYLVVGQLFFIGVWFFLLLLGSICFVIPFLFVATLLWESVRMRRTFPKWRLGSPPRLPKLQNSIAGVKTPCIGVFFISLEIYQIVDVENGFAWAIWTFASQVMAKRKVEQKVRNRPDPDACKGSQGDCNTPLENS